MKGKRQMTVVGTRQVGMNDVSVFGLRPCVRLLSVALCVLTVALLTLAPASSLAAPIVSGTKATAITHTTAQFEGLVDPEGEGTSYRFEYVPQAVFEESGYASASLIPTEVAGVGSGNEDVAVAQFVKGLSPSVSYRFRLVASNPSSTTNGPSVAFTTYAKPIDGLPNGRAYEQATPVDKNGADVGTGASLVQASENGDAIIFFFNAGVPGGVAAQDYPLYLASRTSSQWSTQGLFPPLSYGQEVGVRGWSPDLKAAFIQARAFGNGVSGNFLMRDNANGSLETMAPGAPPGSVTFDYIFAGVSSDRSKVVFENTTFLGAGQLLPGAAPEKPNVYMWDKDSGELSLVGILNDGQAPMSGTFAGPYQWFSSPKTDGGGMSARYYTQETNAVSDDGTRAFFTVAGSAQLYLRQNPSEEQSQLDEGRCTEPARACTLQISASQKENGSGPGGTDPNGPRPAEFLGATPDGSKAFFSSSEELTDDANTGPDPAIGRANLDGSDANQTFIPSRAAGIALDGTHVYWANPALNAIGRANLDGSGVDPNFITGAHNPQGIAVDASHVYWTNAGTGINGAGTLGRANLDGSGVDQAFITGAHSPRGVAVNATHIYWANAGTTNGTRRIGRANLDGSSPSQSFINSGNQSSPRGVALSSTHVYWANATGNVIGRANLDGTGLEASFLPGAINPQGLAVNASHVFWGNAGTIGRANLDGTEANQSFIPGVLGGIGIALDASHVYWSNNAGAPGKDLYRYDVESGELTDLAPDFTDPNGAEVRGVLGMSDDGSHVYFAANGVLAPGASPGNCPIGIGAGACNLYLWNEGAITFIARLDNGSEGGEGSDGDNWRPLAGSASVQRTARVSSDGLTLLFRSRNQLTTYDNTESTASACGSVSVAGDACLEFYRYDTAEEGLTCISCNPTGASPSGSAGLQSHLVFSGPSYPTARIMTRNLSEDGDRIIFETPDQLVASDLNGATDVYEWEAAGTGSCQSKAGSDGCLYLLSTGKGPEGSHFVDASASGNDVFIRTRAQLVAQDEDEIADVYDVRVGGGLAAQIPMPFPTCEGEACKSSLALPPSVQTPGSSTFTGAGNAASRKSPSLRRCARGKVRRRGKCVSKRAAGKNRRAER